MTQLIPLKIKLQKNTKWPYFQWTSTVLIESLCQTRYQQGWLQAKQDELHPNQHSLNLQQVFNPNTELSNETRLFFEWWKNTPTALDPIIRSGIAFLWVYLIENDLKSATKAVEVSLQKDGFYLFSAEQLLNQLLAKSQEYQLAIEKCHNSECDITNWLQFFIETLHKNFLNTKQTLQKISLVNLNERQKYILSLMLQNQEKIITNKKYQELTFTSRESAKRDLADLMTAGILKNDLSRGRSVSYRLG